MGEHRWLKAPRMNGARGWVRLRRSYALTAVVVVGCVALEVLLFGAAALMVDVHEGAAMAAYLLATLGPFTLLPFVAVCVLGYQGLRRGLGVAPMLVGLGLWGSLWFLLNHREWVAVVALAVLPGTAALLTHPRRRQVSSAAR